MTSSMRISKASLDRACVSPVLIFVTDEGSLEAAALVGDCFVEIFKGCVSVREAVDHVLQERGVEEESIEKFRKRLLVFLRPMSDNCEAIRTSRQTRLELAIDGDASEDIASRFSDLCKVLRGRLPQNILAESAILPLTTCYALDGSVDHYLRYSS